MIGQSEQLRKLDARQLDIAGNATTGRSVTATLRVHHDGDGTDGSSWAKAFTTIPAALAAASADADGMTLILIAPSTTVYDIDITGITSWSKNV